MNKTTQHPGYFRADGHCDTITAAAKGRNIHIDTAAMAAYTDLQFFALYLEEEADAAAAAAECARYYDDYRRFLRENAPLVFPVENSDDLDLLADDRVGSLLAMENCAPLADGADAVDRYFEQGFRSFGLVWNHHNPLGSGALVEGGLTAAGREVARRLFELPVIVDLAHCNEQCFYELITMAAQPVLVSHSCGHGLHAHPRNLKDVQLEVVAGQGGLVGITFARAFLGAGKVTMDTVVDHLAYATERIGANHICLGSDFDGTDLPDDLPGQSALPHLHELMRARGFSEAETAAIMGENLIAFVRERLS